MTQCLSPPNTQLVKTKFGTKIRYAPKTVHFRRKMLYLNCGAPIAVLKSKHLFMKSIHVLDTCHTLKWIQYCR